MGAACPFTKLKDNVITDGSLSDSSIILFTECSFMYENHADECIAILTPVIQLISPSVVKEH